ncbi:MAG: hypothetical protein JNK15_12730 [Planctomycetes bacterium]|nr:hypothetical protein [Planctomycetota bacterium]
MAKLSRCVRAQAAMLLGSLLSPLAAQCELDWRAGPPANGPDGSVHAILTMPNGDLIASGNFAAADRTVAANIARWDGSTWHALGSGTNGPVHALARMPNGDVVAAGAFTNAGGTAAGFIARWNGSAWSSLGMGTSGTVAALAVAANGDLFAGGNFEFAGGVAVDQVARWDGTAWHAVGSNPAATQVASMAFAANGDLITCSYSGRPSTWNGTTWSTMTAFDASSTVLRVAAHPNGALVFAGQLSIGGAGGQVAFVNGSSAATHAGFLGTPNALVVRANGDVVLGTLTNVTLQQPSLYSFDGQAWQTIQGATSAVNCVAEDANARLVVGAQSVATPARGSVTRWDGTQWTTLGAPVPPTTFALLRMANGDVVVGGDFAQIDGVASANVSRWNGTAFVPLGLGVDGPVHALAQAPNGDLVVAGDFAAAGGAPAARIARWNGFAWSTLGLGLPSTPNCVAVAGNGDVLAGFAGSGPVRFDGLQWTPAFVGTLAFTRAMATLPNGTVAIGGVFQPAGLPTPVGLLLDANGAVTPVAGAPTYVDRLLARANGRVVVSGTGQLRQWDGIGWSTLPSPGSTPTLAPKALGELANGDLVVATGFATLGAQPPSCVARLGASGWTSFGNVTGTAATSLATTPAGELFVGGSIRSAGGEVGQGLARAVPTCPATSMAIGSGCSGGAGPVTLHATNGAWVGGTLRARASGMTANSLAVQAFGVTPTFAVLPGGAPGCHLFLVPDLLEALATSNGFADGAWLVPAAPNLVGLQLRMQVAGIEFGPFGIERLTSTNALEITIGAL